MHRRLGGEGADRRAYPMVAEIHMPKQIEDDERAKHGKRSI